MRISGYDVEILHERCGAPSSSSVLEAYEGSKVYYNGKNGPSFLAVDARGSVCGGTVTSTTPYHTKPFFDQKRKI